jgi:hypothetical protein
VIGLNAEFSGDKLKYNLCFVGNRTNMNEIICIAAVATKI